MDGKLEDGVWQRERVDQIELPPNHVGSPVADDALAHGGNRHPACRSGALFGLHEVCPLDSQPTCAGFWDVDTDVLWRHKLGLDAGLADPAVGVAIERGLRSLSLGTTPRIMIVLNM
jgi:hypothetical protein